MKSAHIKVKEIHDMHAEVRLRHGSSRGRWQDPGRALQTANMPKQDFVTIVMGCWQSLNLILVIRSTAKINARIARYQRDRVRLMLATSSEKLPLMPSKAVEFRLYSPNIGKVVGKCTVIGTTPAARDVFVFVILRLCRALDV
jgi:hypothetical protein